MPSMPLLGLPGACVKCPFATALDLEYMRFTTCSLESSNSNTRSRSLACWSASSSMTFIFLLVYLENASSRFSPSTDTSSQQPLSSISISVRALTSLLKFCRTCCSAWRSSARSLRSRWLTSLYLSSWSIFACSACALLWNFERGIRCGEPWPFSVMRARRSWSSDSKVPLSVSCSSCSARRRALSCRAALICSTRKFRSSSLLVNWLFSLLLPCRRAWFCRSFRSALTFSFSTSYSFSLESSM
mmetsp:Transcript_27812/g.62314  ORF Transcript_27812/g.62314 Transcript_27812/m.62314 type:complete len:244 (-) Transcript_27812:615-1346(-)